MRSLLVATLLAAGPGYAMDIIGHRGASKDYPENTVRSVREAFAQMADGVEVDVHMTRDGEIVVIHDPDTLRTTGKKLLVKESALEAIRALDAGVWKDPKFAGERIPLLAEILDVVPAAKTLIVEVKCGVEILPALERILAARGAGRKIVLFGFDLSVVREAKRRLPALPVLWLHKGEKKAPGQPAAYPAEVLRLAQEAGLDGVGLHFDGVSASLVTEARKRGLRVFVWTVDEVAEARRLLGLGVDALITNRPGEMRRQLFSQ
ncbi:MAG: glycerophosphodiester phosphodiesterase [Myxococcales bacterium]|nr:glycerophosphodiester phosphodiesterase [Myxococcales bacterium]